jgi:hypothetical protein
MNAVFLGDSKPSFPVLLQWIHRLGTVLWENELFSFGRQASCSVAVSGFYSLLLYGSALSGLYDKGLARAMQNNVYIHTRLINTNPNLARNRRGSSL